MSGRALVAPDQLIGRELNAAERVYLSPAPDRWVLVMERADGALMSTRQIHQCISTVAVMPPPRPQLAISQPGNPQPGEPPYLVPDEEVEQAARMLVRAEWQRSEPQFGGGSTSIEHAQTQGLIGDRPLGSLSTQAQAALRDVCPAWLSIPSADPSRPLNAHCEERTWHTREGLVHRGHVRAINENGVTVLLTLTWADPAL